MSLRKIGARKTWPFVMIVAMFMAGISPSFVPQSQVSAQVVAGGAPVGNGFVINADDYRFIFAQIQVAQDIAAGGVPQGVAAGLNSQVGFAKPDPQLPSGLRTVDGSYNNLVTSPDQHMFGAADVLFPRVLVPSFRDAESDPATGNPTTYRQPCVGVGCNPAGNVVFDSQPRLISNLIVD